MRDEPLTVVTGGVRSRCDKLSEEKLKRVSRQGLCSLLRPTKSLCDRSGQESWGQNHHSALASHDFVVVSFVSLTSDEHGQLPSPSDWTAGLVDSCTG
jgi:hypothetical protein